MTSPAPATHLSVLAVIDEGHIASGLNNAGTPGPGPSMCKLDGTGWPCAAIVEARELDRRRRGGR